MKNMKDTVSKIITEQKTNNEISKTPPPEWKGSAVGEIVFYQGKLRSLDKYARDVAAKVLKENNIEIAPNKIGIGFNASEKEKELLNFIKNQIKNWD